MSRGRSYIIHPRGWLLGVVAKNLAEQKLSSVLGRSELSSLSLLLLLLLLLLLSISSPRYFSTFPGSFIGFTERERKREKKRLSNPSSLGFQGLLLAAFNEKKDKTCVLRPRSQEFVKSLVFETSGSLLARVLVNKNRIFLF